MGTTCSTAAPIRSYTPSSTRSAARAWGWSTRAARSTLNPEQYAGATRDYATLYRAIEPVGSRKSAAVVAIEHLFSSYGMAESMAHRVSTSDDCASANLQHRPWSDPATGEVRDESFPDLFFGALDQWADALDQWADVAQTYVRGDEQLLRAAVRNRNYNGMPTQD